MGSLVAAWRAELLVLRKWRVAWVLVAIAPVMVLVQAYVFTFLEYLGSTPADYSVFGTPRQQLAPMLPSQFIIITAGQFFITAPFILFGAVTAGGDWGRGTITTALVQGAGRVRSFAGQVLAVMTAAAVSVLATFAVAGVASELISLYVGPAGRAAATPAPAASAVLEAVGAGLLIGLAYTALGIALGTLCRSATAGVVAALAWYLIVEQFGYNLSLDVGGWLERVYDAFPAASDVTLVSMFGSPGGGIDSATYQPVPPWAAAAILSGYALVFLVVTVLVVRRRDIPGAGRRAGRRPRRTDPPDRAPAPPVTLPATATRLRGVLACLRAELAVMARWPAMRALVLVFPVFTLLWAYFSQFLWYLYAGRGSILASSPLEVLPTILPGQFVPAVLNNLGYLGTVPGEVVFFVIGALAGGSQWAGGTIKTALLQGPGRAVVTLGQALAIGVAILASIALTFAVAGGASIAMALGITGQVSPAVGPLPAAGHVLVAVGIAAIIGLAWGAAGWMTATVLKSATGAFAVILLWNTILQLQLDQYATEMPRAVRLLYDVLPEAATNTLAYFYGQVGYGGPQATFGRLAPSLAILILVAYVACCVTVVVGLTRRRDIA
jgi:ABC-2 type transport system permease protein